MKPGLMHMMGKIKPGYRKTKLIKKGTIRGVENMLKYCTYVFLIKNFSQKTIWKRRATYSVVCRWKRWMGCW